MLDMRDGVKALWLAAQTGRVVESTTSAPGRATLSGLILPQLMALARASVPVRAHPAGWRPMDIPAIIGNNTKIRALGWQMEIPLEDTLFQVLQHWSQAPE
jgi:GDP-4-dehydro-6-deoxy-D-mannose reductase